PEPSAPHTAGASGAADRRSPPAAYARCAPAAGPHAAPVADLRAVLSHRDGDHPLAALPAAPRAGDHDLRGAQRGHPGGADGDSGRLFLLRAAGLVATAGFLVEPGR